MNTSDIKPPKLRVGIIGVANIAKKNALAIQNAVSNCVISAVASRDADKANSFINEYCSKSSVEVVVKGGDDAYAQIIEGDLCDAVYIPLPTTLHKEWVTRALQAGKHVLVEKPVAVTYEDYVEMRQVAFACRKFIMDGTMFVHNPRTDKFLQCVTDENVFGDIDRIDFTFTFTGRAGFFENDIRVKVDGDPLGCIGDLGWYCIRASIVLFCNFKKLSVKAVQVVHYQLTEAGIPFDAQGLVFFEQNHVLNFHCSFQHKWCQRIEVRGRKRSAECRDFVLPYPGSTPMFSVHYQETTDSGLTVDKVDTVEIVTGPPQEVLMWRTFSHLARSIDANSTENSASGGDSDCTKNNWGTSKASKIAYEISSVSLETQRVCNALMESIRANGALIEMTPTDPELLGIGLYLNGQC